MDLIPYEKGSFYVADNSYTDFHRSSRIPENGWFFIIRVKTTPYISTDCIQEQWKNNGWHQRSGRQAIGYKLKVGCSIYVIIQLLSNSLLDKATVKVILARCDQNDVKELRITS